MNRAAASLRRFPVTLGILMLVVMVGFATAGSTPANHDRLMDAVGLDIGVVEHFRFWTLPVATFVQSSPGIEWHMIALVGFSLLLLEFAVGPRGALLIFLLSDWLTAPVTVFVLWVLTQLGNAQATLLLRDPDTGSSVAAHGALAAGIMQLPLKPRLICMAALLGISIWALMFEQLDAAIGHLLGIVAGVLLSWGWSAWTMHRSKSGNTPRGPSHSHERAR